MIETLTSPFSTHLLGCAMCLSGADGELASAANLAIGLMLIVLFSVLGCFLGFIFYLARRAHLSDSEGVPLDSSYTTGLKGEPYPVK